MLISINKQDNHRSKWNFKPFLWLFLYIGKLLEKISPSQKHYANYLQTKQEKNPHSIVYSLTDIEEIKKIITALKSKRSQGHDNLSSIFLEQICNDMYATKYSDQ